MSTLTDGTDEFGTTPLFTDPLTGPERPSPKGTGTGIAPILFQEPDPRSFRSQNPANERKIR